MERQQLPSYLCWSLMAPAVQVLVYLPLHITYTLIYTGQGDFLARLESPITYGVLGVSGVIGGGIALIGLYKVLAEARTWPAVMVIGLLLAPSLLWAGACIYALLIFLAVI